MRAMGLYVRHANAKLGAKALEEPLTPHAPGLHGAKIATKERAAELLVAGHTIREIAGLLGIDRNTAQMIARDPEVVASIRATFEQRRNAAARELDRGTFEAVRFLRETLNDTAATTKERIRCAVELLDRGGLGRGVKLDVHNNDTGATIEIDDVSALTDEQIETAARVALERRARLRIAP